ncbi:MAG: hypothetical protein RJA61_377 [Candidatus Parcubacteria bacterium]|jgi:branched-chain amino acid aminotransferase
MTEIYKHAYFGDTIIPLQDANLSITSSAVLYGLSIYTVLPLFVTKDGLQALLLQDHYNRLVNSAKIIGIDTFEPQWTFERFKSAITEVVKTNNITQDSFIRITIHVTKKLPGTRSRGLETTVSIFAYEAKAIIPQNGARLKTSVWRRVPDYAIPSRAKVNGAYVNSVLGKQDALDSGYDDCIFLDSFGHVSELSAANIFIVRNNTLITPSCSSDILEGINRKVVLELAEEMNIPTAERNIDLTELYVSEEIFACGTSSFIAPVIEVDARKIGTGKIGTLTKKIQEKYLSVLHGKDPESKKYLTPLS